jgi:ProP effector
VHRALACYVNLPRYLKSVRAGAERIDLDGQAAGQVDPAAADYARRKLERLQAERRDRKRPLATRKPSVQEQKWEPACGDPSMESRSDGPGTDRPGSGSAEPVARQHRTQPVESSTSDEAPTTLEEKLSALVAKHNSR